MTSPSTHRVLALSITAVSQLLLATALIVLPQWRDQQSATRGIVTFFVNDKGDVRLWNSPIDARLVSGILRRAEKLNPRTRVRVVLSSGVPWGVVQDLVSRLDATNLNVELQLPAPASL